jgi:tRNA (mo5U34)-methyltransferase
MAKIDELAALAKAFGDKLASVKSGTSPGPFTWYPYQSLSNFPALDQTLTGEARSLLDLAGGKPILDIGCADGDLAFFLESLGHRVDAIDNPITNFNAMCGVRTLKDALGSSIGIHEMDLDADFELPADEYGLVLLLGVLYHLKNPFLVLEKLAKHTRYCLLSTALTSTVPAVEPDASNSPLGFLASERELNGDATVYWIFTDAGFRRLLDRTNWRPLDRSPRVLSCQEQIRRSVRQRSLRTRLACHRRRRLEMDGAAIRRSHRRHSKVEGQPIAVTPVRSGCGWRDHHRSDC